MKISEMKPQVWDMARIAEERCRVRFAEIDRVAEENTRRVMEAFQDNRVSDSCFAGTTPTAALPGPPATATMIWGGTPWIRSMPSFSAQRPRWCASAL